MLSHSCSKRHEELKKQRDEHSDIECDMQCEISFLKEGLERTDSCYRCSTLATALLEARTHESTLSESVQSLIKECEKLKDDEAKCGRRCEYFEGRCEGLTERLTLRTERTSVPMA